MPVGRRMIKNCGINMIEYYSAFRKEILSFAAMWVIPEGIMLSEISQTER